MGVASGDPNRSSVVCWTRLAPDPQAADGLGGLGGLGEASYEVVWEMSTDDGFEELVATAAATATAEYAHSLHVQVDGLEPDTWYWFRFRTGEFTSPIGRTRTTPEPEASPAELRLAFVSCQERRGGYYTAYAALSEEDLDLVLHLGDYIYEYEGGEGVRYSPGTAAGTLAAFRNQYAAYKADEHLQAAHAMCPWLVTWDDHEVENNYAALEAGTDNTAVPFAERRANAFQAYWEHQPLRIDPPVDGSMTLYRHMAFGTLAHIFMLDGRQFRSDQVCEATVAADRATCEGLGDAERSMLGTEQERWLIAGLDDTAATWKALGNQTVLSPLILGNLILNPDQWDGYPESRQRVLDFIAENEIENVVVLTGDIHAAGAANIHREPEDRTSPVVAQEFVGTSITSEGLSRFGPNIAAVLTPEALGAEYLNIIDHGYARCTVTPESWTTEFVMMSTIDEPTATARVDATLSVMAGTAGLQRQG
jgi:alkaline phosphatase D